MSDSRAIIEISGLRKVYPAVRSRRNPSPARVALDGVSLTINQGERVALLGPNGSGKSTLLRTIATLLGVQEGSARVFGEDIGASAGEAALRRVRSRLGVVFQNAALDGLLTARENLLTQAALFGVVGDDAGRRVDEILMRLGLADRANDRVKSLSGGLIRRVDLARALIHSPGLLLLDEPTTGLDPRARPEFWNAVLNEESAGMTVVWTTHLMDEAERADRVVMLHKGKIVADDAPMRLRQALGPSLVRVEAESIDAARRAANGRVIVEALPDGSGVIRATQNDPDAPVRGAAYLAERGVTHEFGPPTLEDVFRALTNEKLGDATEDQ